jgi:hypothetical protein
VSPAIRERLATILPVVETKKQEEKAARKRLKEEKKKEKEHREEGRKKEEHATAQAEHVAKCKGRYSLFLLLLLLLSKCPI